MRRCGARAGRARPSPQPRTATVTAEQSSRRANPRARPDRPERRHLEPPSASNFFLFVRHRLLCWQPSARAPAGTGAMRVRGWRDCCGSCTRLRAPGAASMVMVFSHEKLPRTNFDLPDHAGAEIGANHALPPRPAHPRRALASRNSIDSVPPRPPRPDSPRGNPSTLPRPPRRAADAVTTTGSCPSHLPRASRSTSLRSRNGSANTSEGRQHPRACLRRLPSR